MRIVAVEQYGAGPFGTYVLADLGAEVIKVEQPGSGDAPRGVGPHFLGRGDSHFFQTFNRNKRSVTLDLQGPRRAREIFRKLVATADGVLNNLRGDQPGELGLAYADLADANPRIVCAHLSAYGRDGARAGWPGYDFLMQAEAGYFSLTGDPDRPPARAGLSLVDYITGVIAALALVSGIVAAPAPPGVAWTSTRTSSMRRCISSSYPATWFLNKGTRRACPAPRTRR